VPRYRDHPSPTALPQAGCLLEIEGFAPNYRSEQPYSVRLPPPCRLVLGPLEQVPLQKHCDRCGCRENHLGGDHKLHVPKPLQILPPQQSVLTMRGPPSLLQHLPFSDTPLQHTVVGVTVVPLLEQQRTWQMPLQHPLVGLQLVPSGRHIGVVVDVEVVLVDVVVVGVVVDVEVVLLVVVLVVLLVEVVLVEVVVLLSPHAPRRSPWRRWPSRATRTRLHNHHPEHLLSRTPRHAGLRRRDGSCAILRAASLRLQHGCSKKARVRTLAFSQPSQNAPIST
jgi:hypothetical protein